MKLVAKQLIGALVITLLSQLIILPQPISAADLPARKILSGWIPYYSVKNSIASVVVNQDLIREVSPFWYTLKGEKNILDLYAAAKLTDPMSVSITTLRNLNIGIIPTITDGTDKLVLSNLLANQQSRANIVATITNLVKVNNFDGIDLDFENY
jgi:spore germination protein YaaH